MKSPISLPKFLALSLMFLLLSLCPRSAQAHADIYPLIGLGVGWENMIPEADNIVRQPLSVCLQKLRQPIELVFAETPVLRQRLHPFDGLRRVGLLALPAVQIDVDEPLSGVEVFVMG